VVNYQRTTGLDKFAPGKKPGKLGKAQQQGGPGKPPEIIRPGDKSKLKNAIDFGLDGSPQLQDQNRQVQAPNAP